MSSKSDQHDDVLGWPAGVLRPSTPLWNLLAQRIADEMGEEPIGAPPGAEPDWEWEETAAGVFCILLAIDAKSGCISLLVRLVPGAEYPPHVHAGVEELHMLDGELRVDDRVLRAGDYLRSEPGSVDRRVWSDTGCTGVLIASTRDVLL
jgi:hypothetical protein